MSIIKTIYINQIYNKLYKRAANKLDFVKGECLFRIERSNKRIYEIGDIGSRTLGVQNAKLYKVNIIDEFGFQSTNSINSLEMSSLNSYQTRYIYTSLLYIIDYSTYISFKYY